MCVERLSLPDLEQTAHSVRSIWISSSCSTTEATLARPAISLHVHYIIDHTARPLSVFRRILNKKINLQANNPISFDMNRNYASQEDLNIRAYYSADSGMVILDGAYGLQDDARRIGAKIYVEGGIWPSSPGIYVLIESLSNDPLPSSLIDYLQRSPAFSISDDGRHAITIRPLVRRWREFKDSIENAVASDLQSEFVLELVNTDLFGD